MTRSTSVKWAPGRPWRTVAKELDRRPGWPFWVSIRRHGPAYRNHTSPIRYYREEGRESAAGRWNRPLSLEISSNLSVGGGGKHMCVPAERYVTRCFRIYGERPTARDGRISPNPLAFSLTLKLRLLPTRLVQGQVDQVDQGLCHDSLREIRTNGTILTRRTPNCYFRAIRRLFRVSYRDFPGCYLQGRSFQMFFGRVYLRCPNNLRVIF